MKPAESFTNFICFYCFLLVRSLSCLMCQQCDSTVVPDCNEIAVSLSNKYLTICPSNAIYCSSTTAYIYSSKMTLYSRACSDKCIPRNSIQGGFILTIDCCYKDNCNSVPLTTLPTTQPPPTLPSTTSTTTFCNRNSAASTVISNFIYLPIIAFIFIRNLTNEIN